MIVQNQEGHDPWGTMEYWLCPKCGRVNSSELSFPIIQGVYRIKHSCGELCFPLHAVYKTNPYRKTYSVIPKGLLSIALIEQAPKGWKWKLIKESEIINDNL